MMGECTGGTKIKALVGKLPCWTEEAKARQLSGERKRRLDLCTVTLTVRAQLQPPLQNSKAFRRSSLLEFLQLLVEHLHGPQALLASCWLLLAQDGALDGQPVHSHDGTCSRCAAALGLRSGQRCWCVKRAASLPLAMRRIHFSDRAARARMAGSCSASSSTTRPTIDDLRHARRSAPGEWCAQHSACSCGRSVYGGGSTQSVSRLARILNP